MINTTIVIISIIINLAPLMVMAPELQLAKSYFGEATFLIRTTPACSQKIFTCLLLREVAQGDKCCRILQDGGYCMALSVKPFSSEENRDGGSISGHYAGCRATSANGP
jgi:hypothetical protein